MITYELSESIDAEPGEIFRYLSTVGLYPKWMNLESAEALTPEQGRGQRWRAQSREGSFLVENHQYEQNRLVGFKTIEGPFDWTGGFRLESLAGATQITSFGQIRLSGFRRLMEPLMAGQVRKGEAAELTTLKSLVESRGRLNPTR